MKSKDLLLVTMADVLSARLAFVFLLAARKVFDLSSDYALKPQPANRAQDSWPLPVDSGVGKEALF